MRKFFALLAALISVSASLIGITMATSPASASTPIVIHLSGGRYEIGHKCGVQGYSGPYRGVACADIQLNVFEFPDEWLVEPTSKSEAVCDTGDKTTPVRCDAFGGSLGMYGVQASSTPLSVGCGRPLGYGDCNTPRDLQLGSDFSLFFSHSVSGLSECHSISGAGAWAAVTGITMILPGNRRLSSTQNVASNHYYKFCLNNDDRTLTIL